MAIQRKLPGGLPRAGFRDLGAVAPGVAGALITTAAGLFATILAVDFYNHLDAGWKSSDDQ